MEFNFQRVAIVNRGEPAMRLIHAVRELNQEHGLALTTIALHCDSDRHSMFVREADEAFCLGPASFVDVRDGQRKNQYLDYAGLERAFRATRTEAAWVGWGFVSEHADFADLCRSLGVVFIGPDGAVMRRLGDKIASKRLAESVAVPVAPWSGGAVTAVKDALRDAERLGYPVMIKATAGGGGRGVRRVLTPEDLPAALDSAQTEALRFFGSPVVFLERAIAAARHVEVQVVGDNHGTCWAVGVRDCTLQRRNQKVVEEAPLPFNDSRLEAELRACAIRIASAAGYTNAGTVEFLLEPASGEFYFMEVNTRLQVEHPVTEVTTGVDLVKLQLLIANGQTLSGQPPPTVGCAIEVRLNAEDPENGFSPAPGRLELFELPTGPGVRIDTGVARGDDIAADFDSMIAKIIVHGKNRAEAMGRLRRVLLECSIVVRGGTTNKAFLLQLLGDPAVVAGEIDVGWLDRASAQKQHDTLLPHAHIALLQAALEVFEHEAELERKAFFITASRGRPLLRKASGRNVELNYRGHTYQLGVRLVGPDEYRLTVDGATFCVRVDERRDFERWLAVEGRRYRVLSVVDGVRHLVEVDGTPHRVFRDDGGVVRAPSPALTLAVHVKAGDSVSPGAPLVILEAMKMEMAVVAPIGGRVREVKVRPNAQVAASEPLVVILPDCDNAGEPGSPRVVFSSSCGPSSDEPRAQYRLLLAEMRRLMLGYDIDRAESERIRELLPRVHSQLPCMDGSLFDAENEVLGIFADLLELNDPQSEGSIERRTSPEESLQAYLRCVSAEGQGLPEPFLATLRRALGHYGTSSLKPTVWLDEVLVLLHKAYGRRDDCAAHAFALLEFRVREVESLQHLANPSLRDLLARLIKVTQGCYPRVNDLARQAHFRYFEEPVFAEARAVAIMRARAILAGVVGGPADNRAESLLSLVDAPFPLEGLLTRSLFGARDLGAICLEALVRRVYRLRPLGAHTFHAVANAVSLSVQYGSGPEQLNVIAAGVPHRALEAMAGQVCAEVIPTLPEGPVALDLFVAIDTSRDSVQSALTELAHRVSSCEFGSPFTFVTLTVAHAVDRAVRLTFVPGEDGRYCLHPVHPRMHPMDAERLEVWRLRNFRTTQLPAPDNVYLFHAVAHDNPKDERFIALVDVPDTQPARGVAGEVTELPQLEHLYLEALLAIRALQAQRAERDRLHWNRIVLFLNQLTDLLPNEFVRVARRLAPPSRNLGLEKTVVRLQAKSPEGGVTERVLHVWDRGGTGIRLRFDAVSASPVRPLSASAQRVVQMRRLGLVYPYEIVRMLTPSDDGDQAEFPRGRFVEHDLDEANQLVPVEREAGQNLANVVVGTICNYTPTHPDGMTRVIVLGDGSREMGALAAPECRRLTAALDLAERLGVPVEWFPVSSGAKISMDVGTEALDSVAAVLRRIVQYTQAGGEINVIVAGVNVGAQSYFNAEATMLMHTRGILVMTPAGSMVLTGCRALAHSGGVSSETNQGLGGFERIMGPNGQAQYFARTLAEACHILFCHYEHTYRTPGERFPRRVLTTDPIERDVCDSPHASVNGTAFGTVGDVLDARKNPGKKKPFDIRSIMRAVIDRDHPPLERWAHMHHADIAVVWDAHLGGIPICLIGIESQPLSRLGPVPGDGPETWTAGTLFPLSSKKVARAINSASRNRPLVVLANLSGFDGSPESMRHLQLEYGAEIGRAVTNFDGPIVFCVVARYHGGAYVVFSRMLNPHLEVLAVEGAHASVIGGAPAAAVVFTAEVRSRALSDVRIQEARARIAKAAEDDRPRLLSEYDELMKQVSVEKQGDVAEQFDRIHCVERALEVGSLHSLVAPSQLRPRLVAALERQMARVLESEVGAASEPFPRFGRADG